MKNADILAELRSWRDEFARTHGYDLKSMTARLREADTAVGQRLVRGKPRRPVTVAVLESNAPKQALQPSGEK